MLRLMDGKIHFKQSSAWFLSKLCMLACHYSESRPGYVDASVCVRVG
jgi:hypothetical protein